MKKMTAMFLAAVLVLSLGISAFAHDGSNEKFGLLNQGTPIYMNSDLAEQAGYLGANTVVKVLEEEDGKSLIAWDNYGNFGDLRYYGTAWVSNECFDVIEDMTFYCLPSAIPWEEKHYDDDDDEENADDNDSPDEDRKWGWRCTNGCGAGVDGGLTLEEAKKALNDHLSVCPQRKPV